MRKLEEDLRKKGVLFCFLFMRKTIIILRDIAPVSSTLLTDCLKEKAAKRRSNRG